ncbi:hypothetical protein ACFX11_025284 [Malus domestica]
MPTLTGDYLVYVSTHEDSGMPRTSSVAVYSTHLDSGVTRRLTPRGDTDFSPAVSPSEIWMTVASYGSRGWTGEVEYLSSDIYVFLLGTGLGESRWSSMVAGRIGSTIRRFTFTEEARISGGVFTG